jgi:hypothetical protein
METLETFVLILSKNSASDRLSVLEKQLVQMATMTFDSQIYLSISIQPLVIYIYGHTARMFSDTG